MNNMSFREKKQIVDRLQAVSDLFAERTEEEQESSEVRKLDYMVSEHNQVFDSNQEVLQEFAEAMLYSNESPQALAEACPAAYRLKERMVSGLEADMNRSGLSKVKNDLYGRRKKAAKERMREINAKRDAVRRIEEDPRQARRVIYPTTKEFTRQEGRKRHSLTAITNHFALGSWADRHQAFDPVTEVQQLRGISFLNDSVVEPVTINSGRSRLRGHVYRPVEERLAEAYRLPQAQRKIVIYFSGSAGPNAAMAPDVADTYNRMGATVIGVDYRGFGQSESRNVFNRRTGTNLSEHTLYKDGRAIYEHVINQMGYPPGNVILHGFSLGGAVASKLAADIAEENAQKLGQGEEVNESDRLGGLVLQSAIKNMGHAAGGGFMGAMGTGLSGSYNTEGHLQRLAQFDGYTPVHFNGGGEGDDDDPDDVGDHLSLVKTQLHQVPGLHNTSHSAGNGGHQRDDGTAVTSISPNTWAAMADMGKLVLGGRGANLGQA